MRCVSVSVLFLSLAACGGNVVMPSPDGGTPADAVPLVDVPSPTDARRACRSTDDCMRGEECHIVEGCGATSFCGPALGRPCTDDLIDYCGCDGVTFSGSSTCPPRVFARRGACAAPASCVLPSGARCAAGQVCPAGDGCNVCMCRDGNPMATCTTRGCVDAGPPPDASASCRSNADCPPSSMCQGPQGCDIPWRCVPVTDCTADLTQFCGCDGRSFEGSSTCPGRPYRSRGTCPARDGGATVCRTMDARGEGTCDAFFGWAWAGSTCVPISGCRCVGADCGRLYRERAACVAACGG